MNTPDDYLTEDERADIERRRARISEERRAIEKIMARARSRRRRARLQA